MEKLTYRSDAFRREHCLKNGIDPAKHCCLDMAWFISKPIEWDSQGANPVIMWINSWDEYRIEISRAGNAATRIYFCPWCGTRLPQSKQTEWHGRLNALGFSDPGEEDIPMEFTTDKWWRHGA
ncbi:MAG: hypothetical protein KF800_00780 [Lysobacter sp.]|nr:hypothetical protein [Lysobacter sp.]